MVIIRLLVRVHRRYRRTSRQILPGDHLDLHWMVEVDFLPCLEQMDPAERILTLMSGTGTAAEWNVKSWLHSLTGSVKEAHHRASPFHWIAQMKN